MKKLLAITTLCAALVASAFIAGFFDGKPVKSAGHMMKTPTGWSW